MTTRFGLPEYVLTQLLEILVQHPVSRVLLFGSRAKGNFRNGSDIDLCIDAPDITPEEIVEIQTRIDALDLPWQTDIVHLQSVDNPALNEHIEIFGIELHNVATNKKPRSP